jgi:hypothetical protein
MSTFLSDPHIGWVMGHFKIMRHRGEDRWLAKCPAHDDNSPSLSLGIGQEGILVKCFAGCSVDQVCRAAGFEPKLLFYHQWEKTMSGGKKPVSKPVERKVVASYTYTDEEGRPLFQAIRYEPKAFAYRRYENGQWAWGLEGARLVPYNLGLIHEATGERSFVYVVEGEKKADILVKSGFLATCNPGGTGMGWRREYSKYLEGFNVIILPDKDEPGIKHACCVAGMLMGIAKTIRIITLPDLKEKEDVWDWFQKGNSAIDLMGIVRSSDYYTIIRSSDYDDKGSGRGKNQG